MSVTYKTAAELNIGDSIDFAGATFVLTEHSGASCGSITLDFNTLDNAPRLNSDLFIDCRSTVKFAVLTE